MTIVCLNVLSACAEEAYDESSESEAIASVDQRIVGGTVYSYRDTPARALFHSTSVARPCSATQLPGAWVLTANHCIDNGYPANELMVTDSPNPGLWREGARGQVYIRHPSCAVDAPGSEATNNCHDFALVRTQSVVGDPLHGQLVTLYGAPSASLVGKRLFCMSYGRSVHGDGPDNGFTGAGILRFASFTPSAAGSGPWDWTTLPPGPNGQQIVHGDSGGSCYESVGGIWRITGVHTAIEHEGAFANAYDASIAPVRSWISQSMWSGSNPIGSGFPAAGVAVASWGQGRLDIFARTSTNQIRWRKYDNGWNAWEDVPTLPGGVTSDPAAVSWGRNRLDLVVRGADGNVWQNYSDDGRTWRGWSSFGGPVSSSPSISSRGEQRLDVFARFADGSYRHLEFDHGWPNGLTWSSVGGGITTDSTVTSTAPASASWGPNRIDLFVVDSSGTLRHKFREGTGPWSQWWALDSGYRSAPSASSWGYGRVDVVAVKADKKAYHRIYDGNGWWDSYPLLGQSYTDRVGIVSWGRSRLQLVGRSGTDTSIAQQYWPN